MERKMKILLVDDDDCNHLSFRLAVDETEHDIADAYSGLEALEMLEYRDFDLVVSDLNMPNGNGEWLLEQVKSLYPNLPVVIWTSSDAHANPKLKGALRVISKIKILEEMPSLLS